MQTFWKKYVDDVAKGNITVGMPEKLLVAAFKAELVRQTGNKKLYRIYGWGTTNFGQTLTNTALKKSVWVTNGKVSSITNWQ